MYSKKGFILYFDILGYVNMINNSSKENNERYKYILDVYSTTTSKLNFSLVFNKEYIKNKKRLFMRCFSDNFLFLYENIPFEECQTKVSKDNYFITLNGMIGMASLIQTQFLEQGILTRGSLSFGEIFYNKYIVYGKSLVNSVLLEEGHPDPSIVVDEYFSTISNTELYSYAQFVTPFVCHRNSELDHQAIVLGIKKYLSTLNLTSYKKEDVERIKAKIDWIVEQMNEYFEYKNVKKYLIDDNFKLNKTSNLINLAN